MKKFSLIFLLMVSVTGFCRGDWLITTVAGNGTAGYSGDTGLATNAQLNSPMGVSVDASGNIFIADYSNNCVRKVDGSGIITTVAGTGVAGYSGDSGPATSAQLNYPYGVAVDTSGNIFIADIGNNRIRKVFWGIAPETGLVGYWRFENNAIDSSGYGNQGTILGGAGFGTGCYEGSYSLSLDGVDDCVEVSSSSSLDLSGNFTIELWISIGNYSETMNMVNKRDDAYGIQLEYPGVVRFYSAGSHMDSPQNALPTYNSWIHIAAVFTGSEKIIYVNGRAVTTHQFSSPPAINTAKLLIGRHSYSAMGQYFNGNIDDVKIYNYARSASEIAADAGVPFSGDSSSFEIWRNVFDPRTESCQIRTSLSAGSSADVNIYDAAGRVITSFTTSSAIFNWDGRDKKSEVVANGVYYISINGGGIKDAKPVAIFKK